MEAIEDIYDLTPLQQGLLFHAVADEGTGAYTVQALYDTLGVFDLRAFVCSVANAVARHDILRTSFHWEEVEIPQQVVHRRTTLPVQVADLRDLEPIERQVAVDAILASDRQRGFEVRSPPLARIFVMRLDDRHHRILLSTHHLLLDGWSMSTLLAELDSAYRAFTRGEDPHLPKPRARYRDFVAWSHTNVAVPHALAFWRRLLDGRPAESMWKSLGEHRLEEGFGETTVELTGREWNALEELRRHAGVTMAVAAQTCVAISLGLIVGRSDVVFGTTVTCRPPEIEGIDAVLGLFINTIPVRVRWSATSSFMDVATELQAQQAARTRHELAPLHELADDVGDPTTRQPFDTLVVYENQSLAAPMATARDQARPSLEVHAFDSLEQTHYPVTFAFIPRDGLVVRLLHDRAVLPSWAAQRLLKRVRAVIEAAADPTRPVSSVPVIGPHEQHHLVHELNAGATPRHATAGLDAAFTAVVRARPDAVAFVGRKGHLTFARLDQCVDDLAAELADREIGAGDVVALHLDRSVLSLVFMLACSRRGAAYVFLDTKNPIERLATLVATLRPDLVIAPKRLLKQLSSVTAEWDVDEVELGRVRVRANPPPVRTHPEMTAYMVFTSGSTGAPKPVSISQANVMDLVSSAETLGARGARVAFASNLAFDAVTFEVWATLLTGGTLVEIESQILLAPTRFMNRLVRQRIDVFFVTTALLNRIATVAPQTLSSVQTVLFGGEAVHVGAVREVLRHCRGRLIHMYGPTEATTFSTASVVTDVPEGASTLPIGRPLGATTIYVVDARLELVPWGQIGEVAIGGLGLTRGYSGAPARTATNLVPDPFATVPGARLYRTGDLGYFDRRGELVFVGRRDNQIKLRGYRIELGEIAAACRDLPGVEDAFVTVVEPNGSDRTLVAYITVVPGFVPEPEEIRGELRTRLPEYMIPTFVQVLDEFPLNTVGKIDRARLPPVDAAVQHRPSTRPPNAIRELLVELWTAVLGHEPSGPDADFFAEGGHSLTAAQLVARVRDAYDVDFAIRTLFQTPRFSDLVANIEARVLGTNSAPPSIERVDLDEYPLSYSQERLRFLERLTNGRPVYNIPMVYRVRGPLDLVALNRALRDLVKRHDSLRTVFSETETGEAVQSVWPESRIQLAVVDVSSTSRDELAVIEEAIVTRPFAMASLPMFRVALIRYSEQEHVLLACFHHAIIDGWSFVLFGRELQALYESARTGRAAQLPPLEVRYRDYAVWQQSRWTDTALDREAAHWKQRLEGACLRLPLPLDRPRPAVMDHAGDVVSAVVPPALLNGLRMVARDTSATLFMVLATTYQALLYSWTGERDFLVGVPVAGRGCSQLEDLIGLFVNTIVLRSQVDPARSFRELLEVQRRSHLDAQAHADYPFERLITDLGVSRDPSSTPVFQTLISFNEFPVTTLELVDEISLERVALQSTTSQFDLDLAVFQGEGLSLSLHYATRLFDRTSMQRMLDGLVAALERISHDADAPTLEVLELREELRHQVLVEWNTAQHAEHREGLAHERFDDWVARAPGRTAILSSNGALSYGALARVAQRVADELRSRGLLREGLVGLHAGRTPATIAAMLGVLEAGGAYLALDPSYPKARLQHMIDMAGVSYIIYDARHPPEFEGSHVLLPLEELLEGSSPPLSSPPIPVHPRNLAYVLYTSGSTGAPKGIEIEHRSVARLVEWGSRAFGVDELACVLGATSFCFDLSVFEIFVTLGAGGTLVLVRNALEFLKSPPAPVTLINTVPSAAATLLDNGRIPRSVIAINLAGEPLDPALVDDLLGLGSVRTVRDLYGPSEDTTYSTEAIRLRCAPANIGRSLPGKYAHVLSEERRPCPVGVEGEIHVGGVGLARGYRGSPAATAERFAPDPFGRGQRLYHTGDYGSRRPDGTLSFGGRRDHQVKLHGFRIELGEIESVLRSHATVLDAAVVVVDPGTPQARLIAHVVTHGDMRRDELENHARYRLPSFMIPHSFVASAELPRLPNGKVDRSRLHAPPEPAASDATSHATWYEHVLAELWGQLLPTGRPEPTTDFFMAGGDSLSAAQLVARVNDTLGVDVEIHRIFSAATLRALAEALESTEPAGEPPRRPTGLVQRIRPRPRPGDVSDERDILLTGATGYLGAHILATALAHTNRRVLCLVRGQDRDRLASALERLGIRIRGHERLRIVTGNLAQSRFGMSAQSYRELAGTIDTVIHAASLNNPLYPPTLLEYTNSTAIKELLRLCREAGTRRAAFFMRESSASMREPTERLLEIGVQRGFDLVAVRVGVLSLDHLFEPSALVSRLLAGCETLGAAPELADWSTETVALTRVVDVVCQLLDGAAPDLPSPQAVTWSAILAGLERRRGTTLPRLVLHEWVEALRTQGRLDHRTRELLALLSRPPSYAPSLALGTLGGPR